MIEGINNIGLSNNANYVINQLRENNDLDNSLGKALHTIRTTIIEIYKDMEKNGEITDNGGKIIPDDEFVGILGLYGKELDIKTKAIIDFICSSINGINNNGGKTIH